MSAELKVNDSVGKGLGVRIAYGLNFDMAPITAKIFFDWVSTAHFCEGYKYQRAQELAFPL